MNCQIMSLYPDSGILQEGKECERADMTVEGMRAKVEDWREFCLLWGHEYSWGLALGRRNMFSVPQSRRLPLNSTGFSSGQHILGGFSGWRFCSSQENEGSKEPEGENIPIATKARTKLLYPKVQTMILGHSGSGLRLLLLSFQLVFWG